MSSGTGRNRENRTMEPTCCSGIETALGIYFFNVGQIVNIGEVNTTLGTLPADERIARTQLFLGFLSDINQRIRDAFSRLFECTRCKDSSCCVAAADGMADSGLGFARLGYQAFLTLSIPLDPLPAPAQNLAAVLSTTLTGLDRTLAIHEAEACRKSQCVHNCCDNGLPLGLCEEKPKKKCGCTDNDSNLSQKKKPSRKCDNEPEKKLKCKCRKCIGRN